MQTRVKIIAGVSAAVLAAAGLTTGLVLSAGSGPGTSRVPDLARRLGCCRPLPANRFPDRGWCSR